MAFYLFPNAMYRRVEQRANQRVNLNVNQQFSQSVKGNARIYQELMQKNLGFSFFLQYLPGTYAYKARQQFSNALGNVIRSIKRDKTLSRWTSASLSTYFIPFNTFHDFTETTQLNFMRFNGSNVPKMDPYRLVNTLFVLGLSILLFGPPSFFVALIMIPGFIFATSESTFSQLPIVRQIDKSMNWKHTGRSLLNCLLNPFILVENTLDALQTFSHSFLETFSAPLIKPSLKTDLNFMFGSAFLITDVLKRTLWLIETPFVSSIKHFASSLSLPPEEKYSFSATVGELRVAKLLKQVAKGQPLNFNTIKAHSSMNYSDIPKTEVYRHRTDTYVLNVKVNNESRHSDPNAFRNSPIFFNRVNNLKRKEQLVDVVRKYHIKTENTDNLRSIGNNAIEEAKTIMGCSN